MFLFFYEFVLSECLWMGSLKLKRIRVPFCPCVKFGDICAHNNCVRCV